MQFFVKLSKSIIFPVKSFLGNFVDIWRFSSGHTDVNPFSKWSFMTQSTKTPEEERVLALGHARGGIKCTGYLGTKIFLS